MQGVGEVGGAETGKAGWRSWNTKAGGRDTGSSAPLLQTAQAGAVLSLLLWLLPEEQHPFSHLGVAHARHAAVAADVGGHALQGHHRHGAGLLYGRDGARRARGSGEEGGRRAAAGDAGRGTRVHSRCSHNAMPHHPQRFPCSRPAALPRRGTVGGRPHTQEVQHGGGQHPPAMRASSAVTTSMITPPFSICARPTCSRYATGKGLESRKAGEAAREAGGGRRLLPPPPCSWAPAPAVARHNCRPVASVLPAVRAGPPAGGG